MVRTGNAPPDVEHLATWFRRHPSARPRDLPQRLLDIAAKVKDLWDDSAESAVLLPILLAALLVYRAFVTRQAPVEISQQELSDQLSDMFVKLGLESLRRKKVIEIDDGDLPFADGQPGAELSITLGPRFEDYGHLIQRLKHMVN